MPETPIHTAAAAYRIMRDKLLEQMPELADDEDCLRDTLEGATTIQDQLAALVRSAVQDEALAEGLKEYQVKLTNRKVALLDRARRKRAIALHYMADLGMKSIVGPDLTISRRPVPPSVVIVDETALPKELMRVKYEPDKTAIKAALKTGTVAGAILSHGSETLQVKI
jgi:hypothetical protein